MFLSFEQYKSLGGTLDSAAFCIYGYEAEQRVNAQTHGRIKDCSEPVARCIVRVTDIIAKSDITNDKTTSFSNDGVSQSFANVSADDYEKKINDIIRDYLSCELDEDGTPLLYSGVYD